MPASFPDIHDGENSHSMFSLFDDDLKTMDQLVMPSTSADFLNLSGIDSTFGGGVGGYGIDMGSFAMGMDLSSMNTSMSMIEDPMQTRGIDPQLVDTPSAVSDRGEDDSDSKEESQSPVSPESEKSESEKTTITIAPVKVGGHGKARKGTVQSGGVSKKMATSSTLKDKENTSFASTSVKKTTQPKLANPSSSTSLFAAASVTISGSFGSSAASSKAESEAGDDDDDLPHDWRPSPEVFAKMTSKEKRQLRNKISARNFRVRRKGMSRVFHVCSWLLTCYRIYFNARRRYC